MVSGYSDLVLNQTKILGAINTFPNTFIFSFANLRHTVTRYQCQNQNTFAMELVDYACRTKECKK